MQRTICGARRGRAYPALIATSRLAVATKPAPHSYVARLRDLLTRKTNAAPPIRNHRYQIGHHNLGASARWFQAADIGRLMTSARAGVALSTADYNRWQPWLMVEARTMEGMEQGVEITPLLRVIHRRILAEAGVSTGGAARFNLTYTF